MFCARAKRRTSTGQRSIDGSPDKTHSASTRPAPPPVAIPTAHIPQPRKNPRSSGDSPSRKRSSGVKLSGPLSSTFMPICTSSGTRWSALARIGSRCSQSSGSSPKAKSSGSCSRSSGLPFGSKQPTSNPPPSSRRLLQPGFPLRQSRKPVRAMPAAGCG